MIARTARWNCLIGSGPVVYPDRAQEDKKLLAYTTTPLERAIEVTGHPVVTLYIASTANDVNFFVYLEDVEPSGRVIYVTEGMLRAIHRKPSREVPSYAHVGKYCSFKQADAEPLNPGKVTEIVFDLLPTSYLFKQDHCIRVGLGGADKDHFSIPSIPPADGDVLSRPGVRFPYHPTDCASLGQLWGNFKGKQAPWQWFCIFSNCTILLTITENEIDRIIQLE